jgi:carboxyl-terminal processing protease
MLRETHAFVQKRKAEEEARIAGALARLHIDWSVGAKLAGARLTANITTDKPGNKVPAGETIAITGQVTNNGTAPAYQVHARARNDNWTFEGTELVFGRIDPGQSKTFTAYVKTPKDLETRVDELEWEFTEAGGARVDSPVTNIAVVGMPRPQFAYTWQITDEGGNGDGLLQVGESMKLHVTAKNVGKGPALNTQAMLRNASGNGIVVNKGRFELQKLAVGDSRTMDFTFDVRKDFGAKEVMLELSVFDVDLREGVNEKLKVPVRAPAAGPVEQKSTVKVSKRDIEVHSGAGEDSPVVGTAKRGSVLTATGKLGGWIRVEAEPGRPGFVPAASVSSAGGTPTAGAFTPVWQVTPPTIALSVASHETHNDRYQLKGSVSDDSHIEDLYVLVSNRDKKIEAKKVFYVSNRAGKSNKLDIDASIPVWPGNNLITVVARESNEVRAVQNLYVLRQAAGVRTSSADPRPAPPRTP